MLSQRTVVPPGFAELASDAELAAQLGTQLFGALLRLCHLAEPARDVPGGWSTTMSAEDLATALGVTRKTAAKWCADLVAAGLLARVDGKRLGRGLGATPTRYFVTAIAGLTVPSPPSGNTPGRFSPGKVSPGKKAQVIAYPAHAGRAPQPVALVESPSPDVVVDVLLEKTQHTDPDAPVPAWLSEALRQIGFVGQLPAASAELPPDVLMRVIEAVRTRSGITSRPRYLNWLLRAGPSSIEAFLADEPSPEEERAEPLMASEEYVALSAQHPQWRETVLARAGEEAAAQGVGMDLRMVLRAAAATPVDTGYREAQ